MLASQRFDVAILGSGIAGTILGAILARNGVRTLILEQGVHPRFAIGESTVPETTFLFRLLAARYDVPEIANLSTHQRVRRHVASTCGVKRGFSFVHHREGLAPRPDETCQLPTLSPPLGPDVHLFRQDVDSYLLTVAAGHGATIQQQSEMVEFQTNEEGVRITTKQGKQFLASYAVDAGGPNAPLAKLHGLRQEPCPLETHSRAIYTHLHGVKPFDECGMAREEHGLPSAFAQGTLHHFFEGGWMWVIPFDNHPTSTNRLCSVGLCLDPRRHPPSGAEPEREFREFIARFPGMQRQFENAVAIRGWISTPRVQFSSSAGVGERFCMVPHAYAFIDPLFSSGLTMSMGAINMLAARLIQAKSDGDYSLARFSPIGERMRKNVAYFDRLVSRSYVAFGDFDLWNAWYRIWTVGTVFGANGMLEIYGRYLRSRDKAVFDACEQAPYAGAQANDLPEYRALFEGAVSEIDAVQAGKQKPREAALAILSRLSESGLWPKPWGALSLEVRHPGPFTAAALGPFIKWVQREAPECIRKNYHVHMELPELLHLMRDEWTSEFRHSAGSIARLLRDFTRSYNRDWARERT